MRAVCVALWLACPAAALAQSVGPLEQHVRVVGTITLEESDSVMTVVPYVTPDPAGGFIVVEPRDAQVRLYDERGRLRKLVARTGAGPAEVRMPWSAVRRHDGRILVADVSNSVILEFDPTGHRELARYPTPFQIIQLVAVGEDVVAGGLRRPPAGESATLLLHGWRDGEVIRSFFPLPFTPATARTTSNYGFPRVTAAGNRIVAAYTLSDTVYVYTPAGQLDRRIHVPFRHWSIPRTDPAGSPGSPARMAWQDGMTTVSQAYRVGDRLLVQYTRWRDGELLWGLACITGDGQLLFDVSDTPRLLAVDGDRLYFVEAGSLTDGRWVVATLR
jgi:hypothetical protein